MESLAEVCQQARREFKIKELDPIDEVAKELFRLYTLSLDENKKIVQIFYGDQLLYKSKLDANATPQYKKLVAGGRSFLGPNKVNNTYQKIPMSVESDEPSFFAFYEEGKEGLKITKQDNCSGFSEKTFKGNTKQTKNSIYKHLLKLSFGSQNPQIMNMYSLKPLFDALIAIVQKDTATIAPKKQDNLTLDVLYDQLHFAKTAEEINKIIAKAKEIKTTSLKKIEENKKTENKEKIMVANRDIRFTGVFNEPKKESEDDKKKVEQAIEELTKITEEIVKAYDSAFPEEAVEDAAEIEIRKMTFVDWEWTHKRFVKSKPYRTEEDYELAYNAITSGTDENYDRLLYFFQLYVPQDADDDETLPDLGYDLPELDDEPSGLSDQLNETQFFDANQGDIPPLPDVEDKHLSDGKIVRSEEFIQNLTTTLGATEFFKQFQLAHPTVDLKEASRFFFSFVTPAADNSQFENYVQKATSLGITDGLARQFGQDIFNHFTDYYQSTSLQKGIAQFYVGFSRELMKGLHGIGGFTSEHDNMVDRVIYLEAKTFGRNENDFHVIAKKLIYGNKCQRKLEYGYVERICSKWEQAIFPLVENEAKTVNTLLTPHRREITFLCFRYYFTDEDEDSALILDRYYNHLLRIVDEHYVFKEGDDQWNAKTALFCNLITEFFVRYLPDDLLEDFKDLVTDTPAVLRSDMVAFAKNYYID